MRLAGADADSANRIEVSVHAGRDRGGYRKAAGDDRRGDREGGWKVPARGGLDDRAPRGGHRGRFAGGRRHGDRREERGRQDRKSTRLNSSHANISYAVFCLKKKYDTSTYDYQLC